MAEDNLVKVGAFTGKDDRVEKYFTRVTKLLKENIEKMAAACFDDVIIDLSTAPAKPDKTPRLVLDIQREANKRGIQVKLVASAEISTLLKKFDETAKLVISATVNEARARAA